MPAKEPELFKTKIVTAKKGSGKLFDEVFEDADGPVTCLGMKFENDDARREYFTEQLREKLKDTDFRQIEGFPIGEDEDILALSDPPYFTACPNPWVTNFIDEWETQKSKVPKDHKYHREPFATDVTVGKTHPIYRAHSYHTKVPHLAIAPSILHYTKPGDIVIDGFCGSGMTGVAAQWCGAPPQDYRIKIEEQWKAIGKEPPEWGYRKCILNDLSPIASFIASNYNIPFNVEQFALAAKKLIADVKKEIGWMYETLHTDGKTKCFIEYTVWSEVFTCPYCSEEVVFLDEAMDTLSKRIKQNFPCPNCQADVTKRSLNKKYTLKYDTLLNETIETPKFIPSIICYKLGKTRFEKKPEKSDLDLINKIDQKNLPNEIPDFALPYMHMTHERARMDKSGITHVHHFFLNRAAFAISELWKKAKEQPDKRLRRMLLFMIDQSIWGLSIMNRYQPIMHGRIGGSQVNRQMTGVYYVPSQTAECSPWYNLKGKIDRLPKAFQTIYCGHSKVISSAGSTTQLEIPNNSIDYIFTDPPFGENIYYSDLNYLVESWYRVFSNANAEAIVDKAKDKDLMKYKQLMERCFNEYYRILKPGRWITIVFHNSRNAVWNAIQEALQVSGFVVADVRTLDKKQGSYRQVTSMATKQDLVISAYKPNGGLEERFELTAGTKDGVWDFIRTHLAKLPVFVNKNGKSEIIAERKEFILFDRMVAFHVQRGVTVPYSANEFYKGLALHFSERDGMYFLPNQVAEYDKSRMKVKEVEQLSLFVSDEASARQWLRESLKQKPQTFQELHPQFIKEIGGWSKTEKPLELLTLLEQNFLCYDGKGPVPSQIHSHLSTDYKNLRKLQKEDPALIVKAKNRWYVPDPNKAEDLEKIREKSLLKEFDLYKQESKKIKILRLEAVRAGFKKAWQEKEYETIIGVANKIPLKILEEDSMLLRLFDLAVTRSEMTQ